MQRRRCARRPPPPTESMSLCVRVSSRIMGNASTGAVGRSTRLPVVRLCFKWNAHRTAHVNRSVLTEVPGQTPPSRASESVSVGQRTESVRKHDLGVYRRGTQT